MGIRLRPALWSLQKLFIEFYSVVATLFSACVLCVASMHPWPPTPPCADPCDQLAHWSEFAAKRVRRLFKHGRELFG